MDLDVVVNGGVVVGVVMAVAVGVSGDATVDVDVGIKVEVDVDILVFVDVGKVVGVTTVRISVGWLSLAPGVLPVFPIKMTVISIVPVISTTASPRSSDEI